MKEVGSDLNEEANLLFANKDKYQGMTMNSRTQRISKITVKINGAEIKQTGVLKLLGEQIKCVKTIRQGGVLSQLTNVIAERAKKQLYKLPFKLLLYSMALH